MKKDKHIDIYPNETWCFNLVVCNDSITLEDINKEYCGEYNDEGYEKDFEYDVNNTYAITTVLYTKKEHKPVYFCWYTHNIKPMGDDTEEDDLISTISHESYHLTFDLIKDKGDNLVDDNQEAAAYLLGWIAKCIYKTVKKQ